MSPEELRAAVAEYVAALHHAYLETAAPLPPGEREELPLIRAGRFTVVVVGTRYLHVLGTTAPLPAISGPEVELMGAEAPLEWTVRFYDATLLPALGALDESAGPDALGVRHALGVADVVYHVSTAPGAGLSGHHGEHAGTGLANAHTASLRDYAALKAAAPAQAELIDELAAAQRLGLVHAVRLLAHEISPGSAAVADAPDAVTMRRALLAALTGDPA